ncbi:alpha/beta fold hydrolase [Yoonia litorea]|uniref:Pimeloyl-ACP methyl ester carboxylesterase n=1 Tax=Yoonia litorea TaxID=1123755 RepID=A0A1I6L4Q2_9RHOB|nr:alpha/beta hydrolase [Yoonia litorea]SFR98463.1 Pimeloyl-ACP methyl ester carboxylesterase [Yoonia litorea]
MNALKSLAVVSALIAAPAAAENIVIVHGAFQSAADWAGVEAGLEAQGHDFTLVNLPNRDAVGEAAKAVSLDDHVAATLEAVANAGAPVVLVGHSFGGMTISAVAEAAPDDVAQLIYVAAYAPEDGESMETLALSEGDNSFTEESFVIAPDYSYAEILERDRAAIFGNEGTEEQRAAIVAGLIREPLAPIATPVSLTEEAFGSVPRAFIRTLQDQAVSTPLQTRMIERAGIERVIDIDTGHAPQTTQVDALVAAIIELAGGA